MSNLSRLRAVLGAAGGVFAASTFAGAQISQSAGTDVIVGDLPAVEHWTGGGAVNGMRAYSVGTTSCNQGSEPLSWQAGPSPNHPVINQAMYRYAADPSGLVDVNGQPVKRIEQIGHSWLKHGFTALQGNVCQGEFDFPCQPTGGSQLGVGCSDPYSASLNGGQSGLGPKFEINPALGTNLGTHVTPSGNSTLRGRLVVSEADLTVPGALYFVEGHYIAADDAAAGNDNNNASYRRVVLDHTNFDLETFGPTARRKAAVLAWADQDPSVTVQHVDVPGDGRFTIAYKVTDLGGGVYDYDYAIFNMNSDRAGAALRFPLAPGLTLTGVEFKDIDYHSGEPYDNTDWSITNTGTELIFASPQTYAQNENTNALRWGTTYNFRFRANAAPVAGVMSLDLFKPGTPTSMSIVAMVPSGGVAFNDDCAGALPLSSYGSFPFDTTNATTDGPGDPLCNQFSYDSIYQDLWYTYTAGCDGDYTVSTCGSSFDTRLAVYADGCPNGGGTIIACEDDSACSSGNGRQTSITFTGTAGTEYFIRVGGYNEHSGQGTLTISGPPCLPVPENDLCGNATPVAERMTVSGTTGGAGADVAGSCGGAADVFYAFTPAVTNVFDINVNPTTMGGANVSVLSGCGGSEIACSANGNLVANLTGGQTYIIRVATATGASDGSFTLRVQGDVTNDDCADAIPVYDGFPVGGSTTDATGSDITSCTLNDTFDVWYSYTPATSGSINVQTCEGSGYDTALAVFASCGGAQIACMDDGCPGWRSTLNFNGVGGVTYLIRVSGYGGNTGDFTLLVTGGGAVPAPANDECANAIALSDGQAVNGSNVGATGSDISSCTDNDTRDVWYSYSVAANDTITVSTCGSTLDTSVTVYDGCNGVELACDDDNALACGGGVSSHLTFPGRAGQTYLIRVAGYNARTGAFTITASGGAAPPAPINDDCLNIYAVPANGTLNPIDTTGATLDGPADDGCGSVGADVWFGLGSHVVDGTATFSTAGSSYDTVITVYDDSAGTCENLPARVIACNDNANGTQQSELTLQLQGGHSYVIRVAGRNGATGELIFSSAFTPAPACLCETDGDDAQVDVFDLLAYLDLWFAADADADIDGTEGVDVFDLLSFLDCWFPASAGNDC